MQTEHDVRIYSNADIRGDEQKISSNTIMYTEVTTLSSTVQ